MADLKEHMKIYYVAKITMRYSNRHEIAQCNCLCTPLCFYETHAVNGGLRLNAMMPLNALRELPKFWHRAIVSQGFPTDSSAQNGTVHMKNW